MTRIERWFNNFLYVTVIVNFKRNGGSSINNNYAIKKTKIDWCCFLFFAKAKNRS